MKYSILLSVQLILSSLVFTTAINWDNRDEVLAAVQENGGALEYASDELKNDREIVLAAVQQKGWALQYASDEHKKEL